MLIFIIGGFTHGFIDDSSHVESITDVVNQILFTGIKWGGITFLMGLLVSMISAAFLSFSTP